MRSTATTWHEAVRLSLAGLGAIVLLLLIALRSATRAARVVAPLVLAVLVVGAGFALAGDPADHPAPGRHAADRRGRLQLRAVLRPARRDPTAGAAAHARLAADRQSPAPSSASACWRWPGVPVLSALGATVAPGTLLALAFRRIAGARARCSRSPPDANPVMRLRQRPLAAGRRASCCCPAAYQRARGFHRGRIRPGAVRSARLWLRSWCWSRRSSRT